MATSNANVRIEWMCTYCGKKEHRTKVIGRPAPGNCPRKPKDREGKPKPHTWTINRTM